HILFGFGAHLDPRIALLRAVTELNQMVSQLLAAPADEPFARINDQDILDWLKTATVENQPYLAPGPQPLRKAADYPVVWSEDLRDDILHCQKLVEERGMELLVLDQTRPEIGMPV